jgi:hypothetical protein
LHEPSTRLTNPVQIIFVHGLGGSKRGTWTDSEANFWPTWLHDEKGLENVRIATFGYKSTFNVLAPNNNLCIPTFANQLLLSLEQLSYKHGSVHIHYIDLMVGDDDFRCAQLGRVGGETGTILFNTGLTERPSMMHSTIQIMPRYTRILERSYSWAHHIEALILPV